MNRYNQGFKYFGPMEQCDMGDWVKYQDHEKKLRKLDQKNTQLIVNELGYISDINKQKTSIDSLNKTILNYKMVTYSLFGLVVILSGCLIWSK